MFSLAVLLTCRSVLDSRGEVPPIRAVIRVGLAMLSGSDSVADPEREVWRIGHGEGVFS
jgi:hypothetical protein